MSIFSRVKKAKKAAEQHKQVSAGQTEPKPPPAPYKHIPTHAAQDALAATPPTWNPEEIRARIAAARKKRSEMTASVPAFPYSAYPSHNHTRAHSDIATSNLPMHQSKSNMPMDSVIQEKSRLQTYQPSLSSQDQQQAMSHHDHLLHSPQVHNAYSKPRDAPSPPSRKPRGQLANSATSVTHRKSPLSTIAMGEDPEQRYFDSSSQNSSYPSESSDTPERISKESALSETCAEGASKSGRRRLSKRRPSTPNPPMPGFVGEKSQPAVEISLPYEIEHELHQSLRTIPTWRYDDLTPSDPPEMVTRISVSHSRKSSSSRSIFRGSSILSH